MRSGGNERQLWVLLSEFTFISWLRNTAPSSDSAARSCIPWRYGTEPPVPSLAVYFVVEPEPGTSDLSNVKPDIFLVDGAVVVAAAEFIQHTLFDSCIACSCIDS